MNRLQQVEANMQKSMLEKVAEFTRNMGGAGAREEIEKNVNEWKLCPIKIAIIGESGTGKSSFINAIRGIDADDENSAAVGTLETTTEIQSFPHPVYKNLVFWDVPGVGTPKFPRNTYLKTIGIERYDFFIVTNQSRFKENDVWLAKEIISLQKRFYFVRTMIDVDIEKAKKPKNKQQALDPDNVILTIRNDCEKQLKEAKVSDPIVFLIDNYSPSKYDFGKLIQQLIKDAPDLKRDALILSLSAISKEMLQEKLKILESRIYRTAAMSALGALTPVPGMGIAMDFVLMMKETTFFKEQLGTDDRTLMNIAKRIGISFEKLKGDLCLESCLIIRTNVALCNFCAGLLIQEAIEALAKTVLPFFGNMIAAFTAYPASVVMQRKLLKLCYDEACRVLEYQATWFGKDVE